MPGRLSEGDVIVNLLPAVNISQYAISHNSEHPHFDSGEHRRVET